MRRSSNLGYRKSTWHHIKRRPLLHETLESRHLLTADPLISEFMASNVTGIKDSDGEVVDWIEIYNNGTTEANLDGYYLTDDMQDLEKWRFPAVTLPAGEYLVVYASGKNRTNAGSQLHTNFQLSGLGEFLGLVKPDGVTLASHFGDTYPPQADDTAYGYGVNESLVTVLPEGATGSYFVPTNNDIQSQWSLNDFNDASWQSGPLPIGYDTGTAEPANYSALIDALGPVGRWTFNSDNINDSTANANNGTGVQSRFVDSPLGRGVNFPSTFDFAQVSTSNVNFGVLRPVNQVSVATWVKRNDANGGELVSLGDHYRLRLNANGSVEFAFDNSSTTTSSWRSVVTNSAIAAETVPNDGQWHLVIGQKTATGLEVWINGQKSAVTTSTTEPIDYAGLGTNLIFGKNGATTANNFNGQFDDVAIFDRALSTADIGAMFNGEIAGGYDPLIATDIQAPMFNVNTSAYVRIPFQLDDPTDFNQARLHVKSDDGFVAYINGTEVYRYNAPELGEEQLDTYNTAAISAIPDVVAVQTRTFDISDVLDTLQTGENILAIQALNRTANDPDLLLSASLELGLVSIDVNALGYLTQETPGERNTPSTSALGPVITNVTPSTMTPAAGSAIVVSARLTPTLKPVGTVTLRYRTMFNAEQSLAMNDTGVNGDAVGGDGIYSTTIPAGTGQAGQMIRWSVTATDIENASSRSPQITGLANDPSPQYYGTIYQDPAVSSDIPILHWFVENSTAAGTRTGTRASLWYNGEFYDNVFVRQRGGSTASSAESRGKTNYKFDFLGDSFRFDPNYGRVEEFNLNSTASDKAYVRQPIAFEAYDVIGAPGSISFPMHVRQNNAFYGVFAFIEEPDENLLAREGLDPNGALYKMYNEFTSASGNRKKTRRDEPTTDLANFITNVTTLQGPALSNYLFDNVNVPLMLNYLVATVITHQNDNPHKNHFLYRDTEGSGEWTFIPWDHDLTWGSNWVGTTYSDVKYADVDRITFGPVPGHDPNLIAPSHPLVNTEGFREWNNHWNRLMDAVLDEPRMRQMYLRRLRSVMDEFLGNPDVDPETTYFNQRFADYLEIMADDAAADKTRWNLTWGTSQTMAQAIDVIRNEYLAVRREHLYVTHSIDNIDIPPEPTVTLVPEFATASYFVPSNNDLGTTWTAADFDDSAWQTGPTGIGFDDGNPADFASLIRTRVKPTETSPTSTSILIRIPFNVQDASQLDTLQLRMKYDDGFYAYVNGTRVAARNLISAPNYNTNALARTDAAAQIYADIDITSFKSAFRTGENVLSIHLVNQAAGNDDLLALPMLLELPPPPKTKVVAGIPHEQTDNPQINFDPVNYDNNPASGNQDQEYLKLDNPNNTAVDISGWRLTGGVEYTFKPGTVITAGGSVYVTPNVPAFRARTVGPRGGQGLFVQGGYTGHLSTFGESVQLVSRNGTEVASFTIPDESTDLQKYLRVTEVHYNPSSADDATEFIEVQNVSNGPAAVTLNIAGVQWTDGPTTPFIIGEGRSLAPGEFAVIVRNTAAFQAAYPSVAANRILGQFAGSLDNSGERIKLNDALGSTIVDFTYGDSDVWPARADGVGASLVLTNPIATAGSNTTDKFYDWRGSVRSGGSPAAADPAPLGVVVNEVRSNTDGVNEVDAIELHNPTNQAINLSGWYLSDSATNLLKFAIPAGTIVGPGGFVVFDESDFNPTPNTPAPNHFALDGAHGDDVYLAAPTTVAGEYLFADDVHFDAVAAGLTLGRAPSGSGRFTALSQGSIGCTNGSTFASSVVISEVQYHSAVPSEAARALHQDINEDDLEYVELLNAGSSPASLDNWRVRGGVDYDFAAGMTLQPNERLLVVSFNPTSAGNSNRVAAFRAHYGIDSSVRLVGGYSGQLSDSTDRVRLERPLPPPVAEPTFIPHTTADEVVYDDLTPWPVLADGEGMSLHRRNMGHSAYFANTWQSSAPTPGAGSLASGLVPGDVDGNGIADAADIDRMYDVAAQGTTNLAFDLDQNGVVDSADAMFLVTQVLDVLPGDINLDSVVDGSDFNIWNQHKFSDCGSWSTGDLNGDNSVDASDFNIWFTNRFRAAAAAAPTVSGRPVRAPLSVQSQVARHAATVDAAFATFDRSAVVRRPYARAESTPILSGENRSTTHGRVKFERSVRDRALRDRADRE